ncbi:DUF4349 domain-containing protein [uncultured Sphingomonas sp.]|uniref:DUF4349 domain-containing protein n=1 Tax=uncultured Sphingomonas sp. TaxID=158754 RepID=UPI0035CAAE2D
MRITSILLATAIVGAGCSRSDSGSTPMASPDGAAAPSGEGASAARSGAAPVAVTLPQIAYSYHYAFRLPGDAVARTQAAHLALCDRLGATRCQLVASQAQSGDDSTASLKLRVATGIARRFGADLIAGVARAGGRATDQSITADDVSKDMTDVAARIHQREALVARLTQILQTREGTVAELVEAERGVADAQEELDAAKARLADLTGRVAMSTIDIDYLALTAPGGARGPIAETIGQSGALFVTGLDTIARLAILIAPWAILFALIFFLARRFWPAAWRRRPRQVVPPHDPAAG